MNPERGRVILNKEFAL